MSINQLIVPNNYKLFADTLTVNTIIEGGLVKKEIDFAISSAQLIAGTTIPLLVGDTNKMIVISEVVTRYSYLTTPYNDTGSLQVSVNGGANVEIASIGVGKTTDYVFYTGSGINTDMPLLGAGSINLFPITFVAGGGSLSGTISYFEIPVQL